MLKKLMGLLLSSSATFLIGLAFSIVSTACISHHGEPDCPKELLK